MKARHFVLAAMLPLLMTGCGKQQRSAEGAAKTEVTTSDGCGQCRPCRWHPGEKDDQGRLVAFEAGGLCKTLESDYGLAFQNTGDQDHPVARYNLSSRESGYESFATLDALVRRIIRIHEPRVIAFYGTCGAPPFNGLPEEEIRLFFDAIKDARVELRTERPDGGSNVICTCPCPKCK